MTFRHKAIYGITGSGKSWLMKRRAGALLKLKQRLLVYSGVCDNAWPKSPNLKLTFDVDTLEEWMGDPKNFGSFVMMDEGAILFDEVKKDTHPILSRAFQTARHKGFTIFIATQFPTSIPRRVRLNCAETYVFRLGDEDAAHEIYRDTGSPHFNGKPLYKLVSGLPMLQGFHIIPPAPPQPFTLE